jgi:hypothetical protein
MTTRERFQLFNRESLVLSFIHERTLTSDEYSDVEIYDSSQLPIRLKTKCDENDLQDCIERRFVPANRHRMDAMLVSLNLERPFDLLRYSHALSLSDTYWIKEESEHLTFSQVNLYDNKPSFVSGQLAAIDLEIPILLTTISRALIAGLLDKRGLLDLRENLINLGYSSSLCRHIYKWAEFYDDKTWLYYPKKTTRGEEIL